MARGRKAWIGEGARRPRNRVADLIRQRRDKIARTGKRKTPAGFPAGVWFEALSDDLLSHGLSHTTIGAGAFHFRVRDGIGWDHTAMVARKAIGVAH